MRISVNIKSQIGFNLKTAEMAKALSKVISSQRSFTVELDFSGVEYMAKPFAEEFYKERMQLRNEGISIFIINMEENIERTLDAVSRMNRKKEAEIA